MKHVRGRNGANHGGRGGKDRHSGCAITTRPTIKESSMRLFVGNFAFTTTKDELREMFEAYGNVEQVRIITDPEAGRSRGFGFVEMPEATEAQAAMAGINRRGVGGRTLSVTEARERGAPRSHDERRPRR